MGLIRTDRHADNCTSTQLQFPWFRHGSLQTHAHTGRVIVRVQLSLGHLHLESRGILPFEAGSIPMMCTMYIYHNNRWRLC